MKTKALGSPHRSGESQPGWEQDHACGWAGLAALLERASSGQELDQVH